MFVKISALLKSPLMIGGKKLDTAYRSSRDYIPGGVLRAAYARAIIQRCPYEHDNYWLSYKNNEDCQSCRVRLLCQIFSDVVFPTLYPLGGIPYPYTARQVKYGEKKIMDILRSRLICQEKCAQESNWVRLEGIHKDGKRIENIHTLITRTAIDYKRRTAKNGYLYAQDVVSECLYDEEQKLRDTEFIGIIQMEQEQIEELKSIQTLHIGADTTRGFGFCEMSYSEEEQPDTAKQIKERVKQFNSGISNQELFVVLDLQTDAYLNLENIQDVLASKTEVSDEQYRKFLESSINLPSCYHLFKVYKTQEVLRRFNTAESAKENMRRRGHIVVKAGSVFVYKVSEKDFDAQMLWEVEQKGIGRHVEHGFGRVQICDRFHIKYDALKGVDKIG